MTFSWRVQPISSTFVQFTCTMLFISYIFIVWPLKSKKTKQKQKKKWQFVMKQKKNSFLFAVIEWPLLTRISMSASTFPGFRDDGTKSICSVEWWG
jgi:hypothetical protein